VRIEAKLDDLAARLERLETMLGERTEGVASSTRPASSSRSSIRPARVDCRPEWPLDVCDGRGAGSSSCDAEHGGGLRLSGEVDSRQPRLSPSCGVLSSARPPRAPTARSAGSSPQKEEWPLGAATQGKNWEDWVPTFSLKLALVSYPFWLRAHGCHEVGRWDIDQHADTLREMLD
jgi:hypothetical protein